MHASIPTVPGKVMVVGFCFDEQRQNVILIRKNKPVWQAGKLNGVGGKIELDTEESPVEAMNREWEEETSINRRSLYRPWREFCQLTHGPNFVFFFETESAMASIQIPTVPFGEEQAHWYSVEDIISGRINVVNNLKWLIPLALDKDQSSRPVNGSMLRRPWCQQRGNGVQIGQRQIAA